MVENSIASVTTLPSGQGFEGVNSIQQLSSVEEAQEIVYQFLIDIVKQWHPELVLEEFKHLFIQDNDSISSDPVRAIYEIVFTNNQEEFHYTIKRACYILINNWVARRRYKYIQNLIEIFKDPIIQRKSLSPMIDRLRSWIRIFMNTKDYRELEFYAQAKIIEQTCLSQRHTSYLLATQYSDLKNPIEQREAARNRALQLKCRFKFDLAMYMARFESASSQQLKKPTEVGDEVLRIIKIIVAKSDVSSYAKLATTFNQQVQGQCYKDFKKSLQKYLICYGENQSFVDILRTSLENKLDFLYKSQNEKPLTDVMVLRTCNKLIDCLTTESRRKPSSLFISLMAEGHPLTVVIILLKIVLVCRAARTHLESDIADLIRHYEKSPEECSWMINFIEIFNIMFAIYADNISLQTFTVDC